MNSEKMIAIFNNEAQRAFDLTTIDISNVPFKVNNRLKKMYARCAYSAKTGQVVFIDISSRLIDENDITDAIRHEIAHALTFTQIGNHTHESGLFKAYCNLLECTATATTRYKTKL